MLEFSALLTDNATSDSVLRAVDDELSAFLHEERTGVKVMEDIRLPWRRILAELRMTPETVDRKKLQKYLEKQLELWLHSQPHVPVLDRGLADALGPILHAILKGSDNRMRLDHAAVLVAAQTKRPTSQDGVRWMAEQIRLFVREQFDFFRVSGRAVQYLVRVADARKKPTGVTMEEEPPPPSQRAPRKAAPRTADDTKPLFKFSRAVRDLGATPSDFRTARMEHGGVLTLAQLKAWMERKKQGSSAEG